MTTLLTSFELETGTDKDGVPILEPFKPERLDPEAVLGRIIQEWSPSCGTYGMGGPGFLGFRLRKGQPKWLIISVWGAADWIYAFGRSLGGLPEHRPWFTQYAGMKQWDELTDKVVGRAIAAIEVGQKSMMMRLESGFAMSLHASPRTRRRLAAGKLREFAPKDDLRDGVFLAPTCSIWI